MKTIIEDKEQIEEIIQSCEFCSVGLIDENNNPYVIPMNFGYKKGVIYLHSGPEGKKIECLKHNKQICISFCLPNRLAYINQEVACSYTMKSKSVMADCIVTFVDELEEKESALNILMKHYSQGEFKYSLPALKNVKVWKAEIQSITCREFGAKHK